MTREKKASCIFEKLKSWDILDLVWAYTLSVQTNKQVVRLWLTQSETISTIPSLGAKSISNGISATFQLLMIVGS